MATVLSLKELRSSNALKAEIKKLEQEKQQLQEQLDRQKQLEQKLRDDIVSHKKDFEHLEKQFDHFAGIEADFNALQEQVQLERLEQLIDGDKKDAHLKTQVRKAKEELAAVQVELKELKKLDPVRLKRQVTDLKKKSADQARDNKALNNTLQSTRKELRDITSEKDELDAKFKAARLGSDHFWLSKDGTWALYESALLLKDEEDAEDRLDRILCLNTLTGVSVVSKTLGEDDKAEWTSDTLDIPEEVAIEAGKRLKSIAAEAEDE